MDLDIQTISLILGVVSLLQVLVFLYQFKVNKIIMGPGWWLLWSACACIGFILVSLRKFPSIVPVSIIFQDIFLLTGTIFLYIGVVRFFEKKINLKFLVPFLGSFIILHVFSYLVVDNIEIRSLLFAVYLSFISFLTAIALFRYKSKSIALTAYFNIVVFLIHGCFFIYRAIMILLGAEISQIFSPTLFNFIPYVDALIVSLLWTFGFIMMINQRLNSEITEAKIHFELIFNTSPDAAVISRLSDGLLVDCNESFTRITGYSKEDLKGQSSMDIHLWKDPGTRFEILRMMSENGYCENFETLFQKKDGEVFPGLTSAQILPIKGVDHIISVTRDITQRKKFEEELKNKNEELKVVNTEKDKFFSIIAHDLRSPFNMFLGMTEIMVEQLHDLSLDKIKEIATKMRESATNLFRLLENLLEWSRMEQGSIPFNPQGVPLLPLINESVILSLERAKFKEIKVNYDVADDFMIYADKNIIQTVIRNLVSNAVKFTPRGGEITLSAIHCDNNSVEIFIRDNGIGMNPEIQENLFRLDVQSNRTGTEGETSSGLGLILCKAFIERHGGRIWVESEEGKGSTFHFTIPCKPDKDAGS